MLTEAEWRRGYCLEAHLHALEFGFHRLGLKRIQFSTDVLNTPMRTFLESFCIPLAFVGNAANPTSYNYELTCDAWPQVRSNMEIKLDKYLRQ